MLWMPAVLIDRPTVYRLRGCDSAACAEGSCDKGDGCELHSRIQRPALNAGVSGRCNTHLYSSEATLSYHYPACNQTKCTYGNVTCNRYSENLHLCIAWFLVAYSFILTHQQTRQPGILVLRQAVTSIYLGIQIR